MTCAILKGVFLHKGSHSAFSSIFFHGQITQKHTDQMNLRVVLIQTLFKAYIYVFCSIHLVNVFELFVCEINLMTNRSVRVLRHFLNKGYFLERSHNRAIPGTAVKNHN